MKSPSFQFYPADWRKDPAVQSLSYHDRGVWFEIICLMHESEQRGKLLLNGKAMPNEALSRLLGLDNQNLNRTLTTLLTFGVATKCSETGALMNKRMVRDDEIRKMRKEYGNLGGNPQLKGNLVNQKSTTMDNQNPTPSSSSSSSDINALNNKGRPQNISQVVGKAKDLGIPSEDAEAFYHHFESSGWIDKNGHPVQNWMSKLQAWKNMKQSIENEKKWKASKFAKPPTAAQEAKTKEQIHVREL